MANTTIATTVGAATVDNSVVPYMRARPVEFVAQNLRPQRLAQFFFGEINITRFIERASRIVPDTANANNALTKVVGSQERFYCNTTHAFASAIGAANGSIYINENYLSVNVAAIGANTLGVNDYSVGDIVFQMPAVNGTLTNPTFEARVAYWNNSDGVLALIPLIGTLNVNTSANSTTTLYKSGIDRTVYASSIVVGNKFPANAGVVSLDNVSNKFLVQTYDHRHGIVGSTVTPNANCVIVAGNVPADAVGNVIYLTSATGLGQGATVLSVNGNAVYTNQTFNPVPGGNTTYSLGASFVDDTGALMGIFQIPSTQTVQFLTGGQKFSISDSTIVDDPDATMVAAGTYVSQGHLGAGTSSAQTPVVQPVQGLPPAQAPIGAPASTSAASVVTPTTAIASQAPNTTYAGVVTQVNANVASNGVYNGVSIQWPWAFFQVDPVAQTFITPPPKSSKTSYGIFVSSIDIWFNVKPTGQSPKFPVQLMLAPCVNGVPTSNVIASTSLQWEQINVSTTPDSANIGSLIGNNATSSKFAFKDPVYLEPGTEYAIILYTESPDYSVYIGQIGKVDVSSVGNGTRRISALPAVGSFFKSQNASAWTAVQNQALMFVLNKAVFNTSAPVSFNFNMNPSADGIMPYDILLLNSSDMSFATTSITYKVQTVLANTFALESQFHEVTPATPLDFAQDLKVSSLGSTRRRVILPGNNQSLLVQVSLASTDPDVSPVFNAERLNAALTTHIVNAGGINGENVTITNGGNHINANNIVVTIGPPDLPDGTQATANVPVLNGNTVSFVNMTYPGSGYSKAPTITIAEPGAPANAAAVISSEDGPFGGNGTARYITRKITLANGMDAGDLRVYLSAIRPVGSDVRVYYKALSSTDKQSFTNLPWVPMALINDINSPDQVTPVSLQFCPNLGPNGLPSGKLSYNYGGTQYPLNGTFKFFAIKIVLFAGDPTVTPSVLTMQTIALPSG